MRTPRCTALLFASLMSGIIGLGCGLGCPTSLPAQPTAFLENPRPDSFQSGLSVISGWVCEAERIEVIFDDDETQPWQAAYGTSRNDTRGACGDDGRNGFGLLFNWSLLEPGRHTLSVRADGREFAQAKVTVTELGEEFLRGVGRYERLEDFPRQGTDSIVAWQESLQNFLIARTDPFAPSIQSMDAAGDSITKAFNADINTCPNDRSGGVELGYRPEPRRWSPESGRKAGVSPGRCDQGRQPQQRRVGRHDAGRLCRADAQDQGES